MDRREFLLTTGGAAGLALLRPGLRPADAAQGENRMKGQSFVFNQDCNDVNYSAPPGNAQEWIRDWYRRAFAAGAGVFVADVALPDVVETKDTPTGEIIGARFAEDQEDVTVSAGGVPVERIRWYRTVAELMAEGTDVLHLACEEGRKAGAIVLGGMRMSDAHHGNRWQAESDSPLFAQFIMDHPEWCNTWEDGSRDATLNYAVPEVQAHRLQILREIATNYDIDGLELDWMRWCRHFPAGKQREHVDVLTGFVRDVRAMLDEVARAKGRDKLILGHRVAVTLQECLNIGCDVETWAKEGYADFLAPMDFLLNDLNVRTDEFVQAVEGTECLVYPGFGQPRYSFSEDYPVFMRSLDEFRALAHNIYAWGAAGGSCFNMYLWQAEQQEFYTQAVAILSDPKKALVGPRHYIYLPVWKGHGGGGGPTGRHNAQSLTLGPKRQVFAFRMADGRNGEKLEGVLRFRIYDAKPEDEFAIDLNGETIPRAKLQIEDQPQGDALDEPGGPVCLPREAFTWPANLCLEVALADCPPFRGDNELGITLVKTATRWNMMVDVGPEKDRVMEALEVRVTG